MADIGARLSGIVGERHVLTDADVMAGFVTDWTGRWTGRASAVVRPGTTAEVAAVLAECRRSGVAVVPQGGNTGLVAGGIPHDGEILLSLTRLTDVLDVDAAGATVEVGAGTTLSVADATAAAAGLAVGLDLGSRDSATMGGMVATNAAGTRMLRYGSIRDQIVDATAVLADGRVVGGGHPLVKDNTGYHLPSLWCGSEGTLAVVTSVRMRLFTRPSHRVTALVGLSESAQLPELVAHLRADVPSLEALEMFTAAGAALVEERLGLSNPLADHPLYLLAEAAGGPGTADELGSALARRTAVAVADDQARAEALWALRHGHTEAIRMLGPAHKLDVTVAVDALPSLLAEIPAVVADRAPGADVWLFGHAGDGNVHINVTGLAPDDDTVDDAVLRWVVDRGGSISAEHGIGRAKQRWLPLARTETERAVFAQLKAALDPDGILNPGVLGTG